MEFSPTNLAGRALRRLGEALLKRNGIQGVWIDVGAHHVEETMGYARHNPGLQIYAVEPNLRAAARLMGRSANYFVIPVAIAEEDGSAVFNVNQFEMASSLLPLNQEAVRSWVGVENHKVESTVIVPTIRLDTLMNMMGIAEVDFLKIDAQGMDLSVLRSTGTRLRDIQRIVVEVVVAPTPLYHGAPAKQEVVDFLERAGFALVKAQGQTYGQEENLEFVRAQRQ